MAGLPSIWTVGIELVALLVVSILHVSKIEESFVKRGLLFTVDMLKNPNLPSYQKLAMFLSPQHLEILVLLLLILKLALRELCLVRIRPKSVQA